MRAIESSSVVFMRPTELARSHAQTRSSTHMHSLQTTGGCLNGHEQAICRQTRASEPLAAQWHPGMKLNGGETLHARVTHAQFVNPWHFSYDVPINTHFPSKL
jgi:hypothetical protein